MIAAVTRAEANLLTLARVAVGAFPAQDAMPLLVALAQAPAKLGPTARGLLSNTLATGTVAGLARSGGWQSHQGQRLWERFGAPPLHFTGNLVRLFRWMLAQPLVEPQVPPLVLEQPFTLAEQTVVTLLLERLVGTGCEDAVARQPAVRAAPLVVLAHAALLARASPPEEVEEEELAPSTAPQRTAKRAAVTVPVVPALDVPQAAVLVEGLRDVLARAWLSAEQLKGEQEESRALAHIGRTQAAVLDSFLSGADAAGQRQLASFLVDAALRWLETPRTAADYGRGLRTDAPLRERVEARRQAGAFLRALARLHQWDDEHRSVRFIDDGYPMAQRLVKDWERLGAQGFARAALLLSELEALA